MLTQKQSIALSELATAAVQSAKTLGMPEAFAELSLLQAILESGWGGTMSGHDNVFGIKFDHFNGESSTDVITHETINGLSQTKTLPFQNYISESECFQDHARIFLTGPLAPKYKSWLSSGGSTEDLIKIISFPSPRPLYATSETYHESLMALKKMTAVQNTLHAAMKASV
jgi:flagellum-specific peptidoglycan hydrolase FlgJ